MTKNLQLKKKRICIFCPNLWELKLEYSGEKLGKWRRVHGLYLSAKNSPCKLLGALFCAAGSLLFPVLCEKN